MEPESTVLFDLVVARMHRKALCRAAELRRERGASAAEDDAVVTWYTDDALGESPDVDTVGDYLIAFQEQMAEALTGEGGLPATLSRPDTVIACSSLTVQQIKNALEERGCHTLFNQDKIVGSDTPEAERGFAALGVAVGTDAFVDRHTADALNGDRPGTPSAARAIRHLSMLGDRHQLRYQLLRHCGAARAAHARRQVQPDLLEKHLEPLIAAVDEELAALAMVPGDDDYFRAHNLPPPCATRLPDKARTRAYMPVGWGGCGIQPEHEHKVRCAAFVAAAATTANSMYNMLAKMGGWAGPASSGYKWAQDLLVQATTLKTDESEAGLDLGETRQEQEQEQEQRQEWPHLQFQTDFNRAYRDIEHTLEWFKDLKDPLLREARNMTSSYIVVAGRKDPIEIKLAEPPSPPEYRADAAKNNLKLQRSLSAVVNLHRYFKDVWNEAGLHEQMDLRELRLPKASAVLAVIPSSPRFTYQPGVLAFALRSRLGLEHGLTGRGVPALEAQCNKRGCSTARAVEVLRHCSRLMVRRHDAVGAAIEDVSIEAGSGVLREPDALLKCHEYPEVPVTPDLVQYWAGQRPTAIDVVVATCHNSDRTPETHLEEVANKKERGWGDPERRRTAQARVDDAKGQLRTAEAANDRAAIAEAERALATARTIRNGAYHPGYGEPSRRANVEFHSFNITALGGYGRGARAAVADMSHPGDLLSDGETGQRFEAEDSVFNTLLHRHYMVHAVAVAFWNASYSAACDVAQGTPPRQRPAAAERGMAATGS